jgi:uncharacterized protein (TIGR01370 family)
LRKALALGLAVLVPAGATSAWPRNPRLRSVHSWAFAIGTGDLRGNVVRRYAPYDLIVIDGEEAAARQVRMLRAAGKLVLAYLDVGTIEPGRPWYRKARRYRLDYLRDWGEWYADVNSPGYRNLITGSVAPAILRKGFDGLFLDNTDMVETHRRRAAGMRTLVRRIARVVHRRGGLLFTQNGADVIGPLLRYYDGWNREDVTSTYDFSRHRYVLQPPGERAGAVRALRRIGAVGLLTLATDYTAAGDSAAVAASITDACRAGAVPFVSDIWLTRIPAVPAGCQS